MASTPSYAANPAIGSGSTTTADTSYTQPTNSTVGVIITARSSGARIDNIDNISLGTAISGLHRLWLCEGTPGPTVTTMTFSGTTATVTCATAHGLTTGFLVTIQGTYPNDYNVINTAVTVSSTTVFTYVMATTPTVNATTIGQFSYTTATPTYHLFKETPVFPVTGSTTIPAFAYGLNSAANADILPVTLPPGWSLRTTVSVTQTNALKTIARGGQF
jgi:hypothetical protein